jgi:3'-phosphoadenosine 5'-phosphosulfate (PAPS) 3'-phosphatase
VVQLRPAFGPDRAAVPSINPHTEKTMSADKDRGIRREKQKRAKDKKKAAKQQPRPATPQAK